MEQFFSLLVTPIAKLMIVDIMISTRFEYIVSYSTSHTGNAIEYRNGNILNWSFNKIEKSYKMEPFFSSFMVSPILEQITVNIVFKYQLE